LTLAGSPLLEIAGLCIDYETPQGPLHALRNVSLSVAPGSILGIVGESGCGKTTLGSAMLGLLPSNARVTGGAIRFDGTDLIGLDAEGWRALRGRRITAVFQDPMTALNPVLSVGTQMTAIQYRSGLSATTKRARAVEFLEKVRIPDPERRLGQFPHEFWAACASVSALPWRCSWNPTCSSRTSRPPRSTRRSKSR